MLIIEESLFTHFYNKFNVKETNSVVKIISATTPLISALIPQIGLGVRLITDVFSTIKEKDLSTQLYSGAHLLCSALVTYAFFTASAQLLKAAETGKALVGHCKEFKQAWDAKNHQAEAQLLLHIVVDLVHLATLVRGTSLEFQCISYGLQLAAGLFDMKDAYDKESYLGMIVSLGLCGLRTVNLMRLRSFSSPLKENHEPLVPENRTIYYLKK